MTDRSDERSTDAAPGWFITATICVGARKAIAVTSWVATRRKTAAGSKWPRSVRRLWEARANDGNVTIPLPWVRGAAWRTTSLGLNEYKSAKQFIVMATRLPCVRTAPLGRPVVPEV